MNMRLWTTPEFDTLNYEDLAGIANGCGPSKCKWCTKLLDNALGLKVFEACVQHDFDYGVGGDKRKKRVDDIRFVCNLIVIALSKPTLFNVVRIPYLFVYYFAVHWAGKKQYKWREVSA